MYHCVTFSTNCTFYTKHLPGKKSKKNRTKSLISQANQQNTSTCVTLNVNSNKRQLEHTHEKAGFVSTPEWPNLACKSIRLTLQPALFTWIKNGRLSKDFDKVFFVAFFVLWYWCCDWLSRTVHILVRESPEPEVLSQASVLQHFFEDDEVTWWSCRRKCDVICCKGGIIKCYDCGFVIYLAS